MGSKRLPKKNILDLNGKPLIAWTIESALKSTYDLDVVVSTDCEQIADISKRWGANIPRLRPAHLSEDTSSSIDVALDMLNFLKEENSVYKYIIFLQPTSPLRNDAHIDQAITLAIKGNLDSVTSVTECEHSPKWANTLPNDNSMNSFLNEELLNKRSQDLETYYRLNGAIYISNVERLIKEKKFIFTSNSKAYIMDNEHSVDIDNKLDFIIAENLIKNET